MSAGRNRPVWSNQSECRFYLCLCGWPHPLALPRAHFSKPSCSMTVVFSCAMRQMTMPKTALATMSANEYPICSNAVAFEPPRPMPLSMYLRDARATLLPLPPLPRQPAPPSRALRCSVPTPPDARLSARELRLSAPPPQAHTPLSTPATHDPSARAPSRPPTTLATPRRARPSRRAADTNGYVNHEMAVM